MHAAVADEGERVAKLYKKEVPLQVYLPADFDPERRYSLVVMPNGKQWIEDGAIVGILDRLFETHKHSALVALVPMSRWVGGSWGGHAVTFLADEVLPEIESKYRIAEGVEHRSLWTVEDKAAVGLTLALQAPEAFGRFVFQSPKLYFRQPPDVASLSDRPTAFYVSWSRYEPQSGEAGTDDRAEAMRLFESMRKAGLSIEGGEFVAGPGYRSWRAEADAVLSFLLGSAQTLPE